MLVFLLSSPYLSHCTEEIDEGVMEVFPLCCGDKSNSSPECIRTPLTDRAPLMSPFKSLKDALLHPSQCRADCHAIVA